MSTVSEETHWPFDEDASLVDRVAGSAYQVIASLACAADAFEHPEVQRALDFFGGIARSEDILPWPRTELKPAAPDAAHADEGPNPMTQAPATGLWGPGDFRPDFETIDGLFAKLKTEVLGGHHSLMTSSEIDYRQTERDVILDLAHDLDARGLVLMDYGDREALRIEGFDLAVWARGDATADADLVTGGE